jgi:hypothetical protein
MRQHKLIFLIPTDRRLELERLIEELMQGVEGYRHLGTYEYDPTKPIFVRSAKPKANGTAKPEPHREPDSITKVLDLLLREHRPFSRVELAHRLGTKPYNISSACSRLVKMGKARQLGRGVYEAII